MSRLKALVTDEASINSEVYDELFRLSSKAYEYTEKKDVTDRAIERVLKKWEIELEKNVSHLSIIGSIAPFVGLFGTVWGIMNSFSAIASSNSTSIAIVAPGISEALFATAVGLFVAIPAAIASSMFYSKIEELQKEGSLFALNVLEALERK